MATGLLGFNPYGGGTVLDISSKPSQFAIQHLQHEQAKDEALDNYFRDLDKTVNTAGVRAEDQGKILDLLANNRDIYFKNNAAIKHPEKYGVDLYNQYMNNYRSAQNIINRSKQEYAAQKAAQNLMNQAREKGEVVNDDFAKVIANNQGKSVEDSTYIPTDLSNFSTFVPHDVNTYRTQLKGVTLNPGNKDSDYITKKLPGGKEEEYYVQHYPDLGELQDYSNSRINSQNPKVSIGERKFAQALLDNQSEVKRLSKIYQDRIGTPIPTTQDGKPTLNAIHLAHTLDLAPVTNKLTGKGITPEYQLQMFNLAEAGRNARNANLTNAPFIASNVNNIIDRTTGAPVQGHPEYVEASNLDPKLAAEFNTKKIVPKSSIDLGFIQQNKNIPNKADWLPVKTKEVTVKPLIVRNSTNKEFYAIPPVLNELGEETGKYDWSNPKNITDTYNQLHINKFAPSSFKANVAKAGNQSNKKTGASSLNK